MKYILVAVLIGAGAAFAGKQFVQQERQYTVIVPAHLVNSYLLVIDGDLNQVTAKDYKELSDLIRAQVYPQFQKYMKEDSVLNTNKIKKP